MVINAKKSQVVHVRNYQKPRNGTVLTCGQPLAYVSNYKYLEFFVNEFLSEKTTVLMH